MTVYKAAQRVSDVTNRVKFIIFLALQTNNMKFR